MKATEKPPRLRSLVLARALTALTAIALPFGQPNIESALANLDDAQRRLDAVESTKVGTGSRRKLVKDAIA